MSLRVRIVPALAAAAMVAYWVTPVAPAARAGTAPAMHRLSHDVLAGLSRATNLGPAPTDRVVDVGVAMTVDRAAENAAFQAIYRPGSPDYHHFLTPAEAGALLGVRPATFDAAVSALTRHGLRLTYTAPQHTYFLLRGTLGSVERTFGVAVRDFRSGNATFYANVDEPLAPAGVAQVVGLESLGRFSLPTRPSTQQADCVPPPAHGPLVCAGALQIQGIRAAYDDPLEKPLPGSGQQIAVIGEGKISPVVADLRKFEKEYGEPQVDVVEHPTGDTLTDNGGEGEWAMDSESSTGMAPGVSAINYYFGNSLYNADILAAETSWVDDPNGPLQANFSVGECEVLAVYSGLPPLLDPVYEQAALEGRTQFASSGDTGDGCDFEGVNGVTNDEIPQVNYPASSPYVVGVGGTELFTDSHGHRVFEKAWDYTGGGTSLAEPAPGWQQPISVVKGQCVYNTQGSPALPVLCKGVPDVSALSGDITVIAGDEVPQLMPYTGNGMRDVEGGQNTADGGTSLSSPLWVGVWADVQAGSSKPLGFAAPALYQDALGPHDAADFYNIAVGQNGLYTAIPRNPADPTGWSYVAGLGSPNVSALMWTLDRRIYPVSGPSDHSGSVDTNGYVACDPNGVAPGDDYGTALIVKDPSVSIKKGTVRLDSATQTLVWTTYVDDLGGSLEGKQFLDQFDYMGQTYQLLAQTDPVTGQEAELDLITNGTNKQMAVLPASDYNFNDVASTVTIDLPLSLFNAHLVSGEDALGAGSTLPWITFWSYVEAAGQTAEADEAVADCGYTLPTS
jgi:pseudomonalisin